MLGGFCSSGCLSWCFFLVWIRCFSVFSIFNDDQKAFCMALSEQLLRMLWPERQHASARYSVSKIRSDRNDNIEEIH